MLSKLDIRLRTPTPPIQIEAEWTQKTPVNCVEMDNQSELIKARIQFHQHSSPTPITDAVDQFLKGAKVIANQFTLLQQENSDLRKANEAATRRKQRQKRRIQRQGALTIAEGSQLIDQTLIDAQIAQETRRPRRNGLAPRRCGRCRQPGHRIETCPLRLAEVEEESS